MGLEKLLVVMKKKYWSFDREGKWRVPRIIIPIRNCLIYALSPLISNNYINLEYHINTLYFKVIILIWCIDPAV